MVTQKNFKIEDDNIKVTISGGKIFIEGDLSNHGLIYKNAVRSLRGLISVSVLSLTIFTWRKRGQRKEDQECRAELLQSCFLECHRFHEGIPLPGGTSQQACRIVLRALQLFPSVSDRAL